MSESIAISTGHATFEAFIEEYAQRCDEHYLVIDVGTAVNVGDAVEFALYLDDGSPVFYGAGECVESSDNGEEVDASYRYRLILGALALDEENQNVLAHILAARGAEAPQESFEEAQTSEATSDDDNALPEEPTSFIDDGSFVSDAPQAEALSPEATSLVDTNDFVSSQPSSPPPLRVSSPAESFAASPGEAPEASVSAAPAAEIGDDDSSIGDDDSSTRELDLASLSDVGPSIEHVEVSSPSIPVEAAALSEDADEFEDPATTIGQIASAPASVPAAALSAAPSIPPVSFDDDVSDSEPAAPLRFSGPPLSAPLPSEVSAVSPLPARPESGLRRITMTPSWSPVAEPSESMGASSGLFAYANGVLPIPAGPARPRNAVARVLFARELLDLAAAAPAVDEDNATSEIDIGSL